MNSSDLIALASLLVALTGMITGFFLQRDVRKIRDLERDNKTQRRQLRTALKAIKGYQAIENEYAEQENMPVKKYRTKVRQNKRTFFDSAFLAPSNIDKMLEDVETGV